MVLNVGDRAPNFSLPASTGETVSLSDLVGGKVVLYFYPKDDTPGCIKEACGFRDSMVDLGETNVVVFGVSPDSLESHDKFISKYGLNFPLLSDEDKSVSISYGAWGKKTVYGKQTVGMNRMTFLIDEKGFLAEVWEQVIPEGHAEEVLDAVRGT